MPIFGPPVVQRRRNAGSWYSIPDGVAVSGIAMTQSLLYYLPFSVRLAHGIDRVGANTSAGVAAGVIRAGYYTDANGLPGTLVNDWGASVATFSSTVVGNAGPITTTDTLPPGDYWAAMVVQGAAATMWGNSNNGMNTFEPLLSQGQVFGLARVQANVTSALPVTAVSTGDASTFPLLQIRAS